MRSLLAVVVVAPLALAFACNEQPAAANVCEEAAQRFESCGASLSFVTNGACVGARKLVARCVVDHASDCDELAGLYREIDECVAGLADGGDDLLPPLVDVPVEKKDAGTKKDAAPPDAEPFTPADAGPKDAAKDSG